MGTIEEMGHLKQIHFLFSLDSFQWENSSTSLQGI